MNLYHQTQLQICLLEAFPRLNFSTKSLKSLENYSATDVLHAIDDLDLTTYNKPSAKTVIRDVSNMAYSNKFLTEQGVL